MANRAFLNEPPLSGGVQPPAAKKNSWRSMGGVGRCSQCWEKAGGWLPAKCSVGPHPRRRGGVRLRKALVAPYPCYDFFVTRVGRGFARHPPTQGGGTPAGWGDWDFASRLGGCPTHSFGGGLPTSIVALYHRFGCLDPEKEPSGSCAQTWTKSHSWFWAETLSY